MEKDTINKAFDDGLNLLYKPKNTLYKLFSFTQIVDEKGSEVAGLCYQSDDDVIYTRHLTNFGKFELVDHEKSFNDLKDIPYRSLVSSKYKHPHQFLGHTKIKTESGEWVPGIMFCCSMGISYTRATSDLGKYLIENLIQGGIVL
jgi:hypothetical protein